MMNFLLVYRNTKMASATPSPIGVQNTSPNASTPPDNLNSGGQNNPAEQAAVTSIPSMLPVFIYEHMIFMTAFSWDSSQKPNTVIWSIPLHPYYMNPIIRYLAALFNTWAGSFNFELVIAGTGFNGGKLVMVWVPPNIRLEDMDLSGKTFFSFGMIDPKDTGPTVINARDQRIQKAHWMEVPTEDDQNMDDISKYAMIGGRVALVVLNPLISSSMEKAVVNISIFNSAGRDFTMNQFRPPRTFGTKRTVPNFHFTDPTLPFRTSVEFDTMHVDPVTISTSLDPAALVNIGNGEYSRLSSVTRLPNLDVFSGTNFKSKTLNESFTTFQWPMFNNPTVTEQKTMMMHRFYLETSKNFALSSIVTTGGGEEREGQSCTEFTCYLDGNQPDSLCTYQFRNDDFTAAPHFPNLVKIRAIDETNRPEFKVVGRGTWPVQDWEKIESDIGENILSFGYQNDEESAGYPVTTDLFRYLRAGPFAGVQDPVFNIVDSASSLPLMTIRLNREGYFTTAPVTKRVNFELSKIYLEYQYSIDHSAKLPQTPKANLAIHQAHISQRELDSTKDKLVKVAALVIEQRNELLAFKARIEELEAADLD